MQHPSGPSSGPRSGSALAQVVGNVGAGGSLAQGRVHGPASGGPASGQSRQPNSQAAALRGSGGGVPSMGSTGATAGRPPETMVANVMLASSTEAGIMLGRHEEVTEALR
jgi:hypothetical protein